MLLTSSAATRSFIRSNATVSGKNVHLMLSVASSSASEKSQTPINGNLLAKRGIHSGPPQLKSAPPPLQYAAPQPTYTPEEVEEDAPTKSSYLVHRLKTTAEVTVSKIFPAGFG
jgi:hypothetical protein